MTKHPCMEPDCDRLSYGYGKCKSHYMKEYRQQIKADGYQRTRGEGPKLERRDYNNIDPDDFWEFVKKEMKIA